MDSKGHNPARIPGGERLHPVGRVRMNRVEQAGALKVALRGFMRKAVFQVAVVILIRLWVDDYRMVKLSCLDERKVLLECKGGCVVGSVPVIREPVWREKMDMSID